MRIRRLPLPSKRKRATGKKVKRPKEKPLAKVDDEIEFLWPGWIAPRCIIKGTVIKVEAGICTDGPYLYTVKFETQKVFPLESRDKDYRILTTVTGRTYQMGKGCIEQVQRYK